MKIQLGIFDYKLSKAQEKVVKTLIENPDFVVIPTRFYNNQQIFDSDLKLFLQFKKTTFEWLRKRQILIPKGKSYFGLNNLVKMVS